MILSGGRLRQDPSGDASTINAMTSMLPRLATDFGGGPAPKRRKTVETEYDAHHARWRYEGEIDVETGYKDGWGVMRNLDQDTVYKGQWYRNMACGLGVYRENESTTRLPYYIGDFDAEVSHGKGIQVYEDGSVYEGEFVSDRMEGFGTFLWASGKKYVGHFRKNKRHGFGTLFWTDGVKHTGEFVKNETHGKGVVTYPNGEEYEGWWEADDVLIGKGIIHTLSGGVYEIEWRPDSDSKKKEDDDNDDGGEEKKKEEKSTNRKLPDVDYDEATGIKWIYNRPLMQYYRAINPEEEPHIEEFFYRSQG